MSLRMTEQQVAVNKLSIQLPFKANDYFYFMDEESKTQRSWWPQSVEISSTVIPMAENMWQMNLSVCKSRAKYQGEKNLNHTYMILEPELVDTAEERF